MSPTDGRLQHSGTTLGRLSTQHSHLPTSVTVQQLFGRSAIVRCLHCIILLLDPLLEHHTSFFLLPFPLPCCNHAQKTKANASPQLQLKDNLWESGAARISAALISQLSLPFHRGDMTKSRRRSHAPTYLTPSPSPRELSPEPSRRPHPGAGSTTMSTSRPVSLAPSTGPRMPTLHEILSDSAPHPYTLSAFMAYLSQNHCLETLEFTMEADRYRLAHCQSQHALQDHSDHLCGLWQKLIQAYIQPWGSREVNLPAHVRDHLLSLPCGPQPPQPSELDDAVRIIYELMSDSVLVPFVESFNAPPHSDFCFDEKPVDKEKRHSRSRSRSSKDMTTRDESSRSPRTSFLPHLNINLSRRSEAHHHPASSSSDLGEREDLVTDDSSSNSPPPMEPMTPPTTPPTPDWAFAASPGTLHKAISAHSNGWKKVGAKLGLNRRSRSTNRLPTIPTTSAARSGAAVQQNL